MSYYRNPFTLIDDLMTIPPMFGQQVYVVSDEQYKEYRKKQAQDEIAVLEKRLASYESTAASLRKTIDEIKGEHGLLPEAEDK